MDNTDYSIDRTAVATEVLELVGAIEAGETLPPADVMSLSRTLNMLLKHMQGPLGLNIYSMRETFLFLVNGYYKYNQLDYNGTTGLDVDRQHIYVSEYEKLAFTDISSGATSVEIAESFQTGGTAASAVAGDVLGIPLEDGTVHWAEITSVGTSGSYSLSFDFTGHALASDADSTKDLIIGITYPGRPLKIVDISIRHIFDDTERHIGMPISPIDYNRLTNKTNVNYVNQVMYNSETTTGDLRTWGTINSDNYVLVMWAALPLQDIDSDLSLNTNEGIPQEFYMAITYMLAEAVLPKYNPPWETVQQIKALAKMYKEEALAFDTGDYIKLEPDLRDYATK